MDLESVWSGPVLCRGPRMTRVEILRRTEGSPLHALVTSESTDDLGAQGVLYKNGKPYHAGCGVDLRDVQYELREKHGPGVVIEYSCPACGAPHSVEFGVMVEAP
jgi:hypothetical protein